jgi:hypothetical protein
MRTLWTALLIVAIAAITTAALVDVIGGSGEPGPALEPAATTSPTTTTPPPACDRDQLALELEVLGATNAVALRHVHGPPCQADLNLRVFVTSHGRRSEIPLGDEDVLDGAYSPRVELVGSLQHLQGRLRTHSRGDSRPVPRDWRSPTRRRKLRGRHPRGRDRFWPPARHHPVPHHTPRSRHAQRQLRHRSPPPNGRASDGASWKRTISRGARPRTARLVPAHRRPRLLLDRLRAARRRRTRSVDRLRPEAFRRARAHRLAISFVPADD